MHIEKRERNRKYIERLIGNKKKRNRQFAMYESNFNCSRFVYV